jgi:hypothetical protein
LRQAAWSFWRSTRRHKESLPVPPAALCPCPVFAAAAPASGSALQRPLIPAVPEPHPPPPPSAYGQPMPSTGRIRHQYANKQKKEAIPLDHPASPVDVGEFPVDAPRGNSTLSPGPVMYDMPMLDSTAPSVDYACYDACRADSCWQHERVALEEQLQQRLAGAGASAHRGLRSAVT